MISKKCHENGLKPVLALIKICNMAFNRRRGKSFFSNKAQFMKIRIKSIVCFDYTKALILPKTFWLLKNEKLKNVRVLLAQSITSNTP